jgi:ABC-type molybdenum transport system ATPase subunit/photorepair protein PhrA
VGKRNWIQKHIAWTRFSENKWIKEKNQEISSIQKKLDRNIKYDNKLSDIIIKANNGTNKIVNKNIDLFVNVKKEYETKANELLAQEKARQTAQSNVSVFKQSAQSNVSALKQSEAQVVPAPIFNSK